MTTEKEKNVVTNQVAVQKGKRSEWLDVAKGFGIFCVVYVHAKSPASYYSALFIMPFFFLVSGYLYNSKDTLKDFVIKKVKTLYIPFVGWNMLVMLARLIPRALNGEMSVKLLIYTLQRFVRVLLTLEWEGDYLGATWFLGALFLVSVAYKCFDVYVQEGKYKRLFITLVFTLTAIAAFYLEIPYIRNRVLIFGMFYAFGYVLRLEWDEIKKCSGLLSAIWALLLFLWVGHTTRANYGENTYSNRILFMVAVFVGSYVIFYFSARICEIKNPLVSKVKQLLAWWGRESMDIVIWHFTTFRLLSAFQFWLEGEPITNAFATRVYITSGFWWAAYIAVGIFASLLWGWLLRQGFWGKILKKLYLVR